VVKSTSAYAIMSSIIKLIIKLLNNPTLCWDSEQRRRHDLFVSRIVGILVYYGVVFVTWTGRTMLH
jgi:hypothetical protein